MGHKKRGGTNTQVRVISMFGLPHKGYSLVHAKHLHFNEEDKCYWPLICLLVEIFAHGHIGRSMSLIVITPHALSPGLLPASPHLIKELFASSAGLDGKLQLRIHGGHAYIHLRSERNIFS